MTVSVEDHGTPMDERPLGQLAVEHLGSEQLLASFGLDHCCGGRRPLREACAAAGVDPNEVVAALRDLDAAPVPDWVGMGPDELVDHLVATHHRYLHAELPRLDALAEKVASVHGDRHPELMEVLADLRELRDDLEPHLAKEERILFPLIRELVAEVRSGQPTTPLAGPVRVMRAEHERAGELLDQLRAHTGGFTVPDDACASYQGLYEGLARLDEDTRLHVHKENNVLFPAIDVLGA